MIPGRIVRPRQSMRSPAPAWAGRRFRRRGRRARRCRGRDAVLVDHHAAVSTKSNPRAIGALLALQPNQPTYIISVACGRGKIEGADDEKRGMARRSRRGRGFGPRRSVVPARHRDQRRRETRARRGPLRRPADPARQDPVRFPGRAAAGRQRFRARLRRRARRPRSPSGCRSTSCAPR